MAAATRKRSRRIKQDWKPVHGFDRDKGPTYCSPACGGRCTKAEYERAVTEGRVLAARLGPKFVHRVWENLGWQWAAWTRCKRVCVYPPPYGAGRFSAFIRRDAGPGGEFVGHGRTPRAAIRDAFRQAAEKRDELNELLAIADEINLR